jgi:MFS family permease
VISLIPLVNSTWSIYGLILLSAVFASPIYPASLALAADITSEGERGTVMGFMMTSSNLAGALGSLVAGLIVSIVSAPGAGFAYSFAPALLVGLVGYFLFDTNVSNKSPGDSKDETI